MSTESTILRRPDHFLAVIIIDLRNKVHIQTLVGHYSELFSDDYWLDPNQLKKSYLDLGGHRMVFLQNCIKTWKEFKEFYNFCVEQGVTINMSSLFIDLHNLCDHYTAINQYGKTLYSVHPQIRRDAVTTRHNLYQRSREFDLNYITSPYHHVPIELGAFLQSVRAG